MNKSNFKSHTELICWQKARILVSEIYSATEKTKEYIISDQIQRAGLSIMNNIAEGYSRFTTKEKSRYFQIAMSSCTEVKSITDAMEDKNYCSIEKITLIRNHVTEVHKMIIGLDKYFRSSSKKTTY